MVYVIYSLHLQDVKRQISEQRIYLNKNLTFLSLVLLTLKSLDGETAFLESFCFSNSL